MLKKKELKTSEQLSLSALMTPKHQHWKVTSRGMWRNFFFFSGGEHAEN